MGAAATGHVGRVNFGPTGLRQSDMLVKIWGDLMKGSGVIGV